MDSAPTGTGPDRTVPPGAAAGMTPEQMQNMYIALQQMLAAQNLPVANDKKPDASEHVVTRWARLVG